MDKLTLFGLPDAKYTCKNIYDILRIAFLYGESDKILRCNEMAFTWLKENELDKIDPLQEGCDMYITPFGQFKIVRYADDNNNGALIITDQKDSIFWFNTTTHEYLWLSGPRLLHVEDHPEVIPKIKNT